MSVDRLVDRLFDHAGLFPPAALDWNAMVDTAAGFDRGLHRRGLVAAHFVVRPTDLPALAASDLVAAGFPTGTRLDACLVGVDAAGALEAAQTIAAWNDAHRDDAVPTQFVSLEVHSESLDDVAARLHAARVEAGPGVRTYFEPKWGPEAWREGHRAVFAMLERLADSGPAVGIKFRCAGPTAIGAQTIASIFADAVRLGIPVKATQGLHHPFAGDPRHANALGFLSMVAALRLAGALGLDAPTVREMLEDPEAESFVFDPGLGWRHHRAAWQRVAEAASKVPFAIGSCSLDEPDDDLKALYG